ncbi:MAG TPA: hypothetical protein VMR99_02205 [Candidatus Paceibacterota bacterium]|nr:hypothetical protein [Candidatus Paceibacterota bacterium]
MLAFPKSAIKDFPKEFSVFKTLRTPAAIQDYVNGLKMNFTGRRHTYASPLVVLETGKAHCMEGAMLAAAALWYQGQQPLLLDLKTTDADEDHVVALFKEGNRWGAISKTNHAVLRYRDPVYKDPRELAMSYFNEYFLDSGAKTMRSYSAPFDMLKFGEEWLTTRGDLTPIAEALDFSRHFQILKKDDVRDLRRAEPIEIKAGKIVQQKKK